MTELQQTGPNDRVSATAGPPDPLVAAPGPTETVALATTQTGRRGPLRTAGALVRAVRPKQWLKNCLVIGAPLSSGRILEVGILTRTVIAFVAFCLAASAIYLVNDLIDVAEDRLHPTKRFRPIAAGQLSRTTAWIAAVVLGAGGLGLAVSARLPFAALVLVYVASSLAYSRWLRSEPVVELTVVASGFLLRAAGGGVAADLRVSSWFLFVAGFGSLFLVAGKRYCELVADRDPEHRRRSLAAYSPAYLRFIWMSAATTTIMAYALWADQVGRVEDGPWALWSVFPFVLAILIYAYDIDRGRAETPEDAVLADRGLQVAGLVWFVLFSIGALGFGT